MSIGDTHVVQVVEHILEGAWWTTQANKYTIWIISLCMYM